MKVIPTKYGSKPLRVGYRVKYLFLGLVIFSPCFAIGYQVSGQVRDSESGNPVGQTKVLVVDLNISTVTDSSGKYVLDDLPSGTYKLTFIATGYLKETRELKFNQNRKLTVSLTPIPIFTGEELVITAKPPVYKKPQISRETVSHEIVDKTVGTKDDVFETIKTLPGVLLANDFAADFSVRGGSPGETKVYIDGVPIISPYHLEMFGSSLGPEQGGFVTVLNNDLLKEVNLYTGGYPAQLGNALSGIVEVTTRDVGEKIISGKVAASFVDAKLFCEGRLFKPVTWILTYRRNYQDILLRLLNLGEGFVFPNYWDLHSKVQVVLNPQNRVTLYLLKTGTNTELDFSTTTVTPTDGISDRIRRTFHWLTEGTFIFVNWSSKFSADANLFTSLSWENKQWDSRWKTESNLYYWGGERWIQIKYGLGNFKTEFTKKIDSVHELKLGITYSPFNTLFDTKVRNRVFTGLDSSNDETLSNFETKDYYGFVFLQDKWQIFNRLTTEFGLRYDYLHLNNSGKLSPRISLVYGLTDDLALRLSSGYFYQIPEVTDFIPAYGGNSDVDQRLAKHYVLGIEKEFPYNLRTKLETYYKDYDNLISFDPVTKIKANLGEGTSYGLELLIEKQISGKLYSWLTYTYSRSQKKEYAAAEMYPFTYDRTHLLNLIFNWQVTQTFNMNIQWRYATGTPYTPLEKTVLDKKNNFYFPIWGEQFSIRYPDYHRLDLRVSKDFKFTASWQMSVYLEIINLYNQANVFDYFFNSLTGKIDTAYQLPFLPLIGIETRF